MTYEEIKELVGDRPLPMSATNAEGEFVIIEAGSYEGNYPYYRLTTAQHNGWCRINYIYNDGRCEELFEK